MFIFAFISIPILLIYLNEKINYRKIVSFFIGIVVSQFISILMWSINTLYSLDSDYIFLKLIKFTVVDLFPIIILFSLIGISFYNKKNIFKIKEYFIYGFLYWNMIFGLLYKQKISNNIGILIMPIIYMILIYIYHAVLSSEKNDFSILLKKIIYIMIPLILLITFFLLDFSILLVVLFVFILITSLFLLMRKNNLI